MKRFSRILSGLMVISLLFSCLPASAYAVEADVAPVAGETGLSEMYFVAPQGVGDYQLTGSDAQEPELLTMQLPRQTTETTLTLTGLAPASSVVEVYINETKSATVTADANGAYMAELSLGAPEKTTGYTVKVTCPGQALVREQFLLYRHGGPQVSQILFYPDSEKEDCIPLDANAAVKIDYTGSENPYKFEVAVTNPEFVEHVYITGTCSGIIRRMDATYDPESGKYVAVGFFDEKDKFYSPESVCVEYIMKANAPAVGEQVDWEELDPYIPQSLDNAVVTNQQVGQTNTGTVDFSSTDKKLQNMVLNYAIKSFDKETGASLGELRSYYNTGKNIVSYVIPGLDDSRYYAYLDFSDPNTYKMLLDDGLDVGSKAIELEMSFVDAGTSQAMNLQAVSQTLGDIGSVVSYVSDVYNIQHDAQALREEVEMSASVTDKEAAFKAIDQLEQDQVLYTTATTVLPLIVAAGAVGGPATMLFTGILGVMSAASGAIYEYRIAGIKGQNVETQWYSNVTKSEGQIGNDLYYTAYRTYSYNEWTEPKLVDVKVDIYGTGEMWDDPALPKQCVSEVIIQSGVTSIGAFAFEEIVGLRTITIPHTVVKIGKFAFKDCENLETVHLSNELRSLGSFAFAGCVKLEQIDLPNKLEQVGRHVFDSCAIKSLVLPSNIKEVYATVGCMAHDQCGFLAGSNIEKVTISKQTTRIADGLLRCAEHLEKVIMPDSVTEIGDYAFAGCSALTQINLSANLTVIGTGAFTSCGKLTSLQLPQSLTTIKIRAFWGTGITKIDIPENVQELECRIFYEGALDGYDTPFSNMEALQNIHVDPENPYFSSIDGVLFNKSQTDLILYPAAKTGNYRIPNSVKTIRTMAFGDHGTVDFDLTIPASVTEIEPFAFQFYNYMNGENEPLADIWFEGDAPAFWYSEYNSLPPFGQANVRMHYPSGFAGWSEKVKYTYGAEVMTWEAYELKNVSAVVNSMEQLSAAIDRADGNMANITVVANMTLDGDLTIPENVTVNLYGTNLYVPEGVTLTNQGSIYAQAQGAVVTEGSFAGNQPVNKEDIAFGALGENLYWHLCENYDLIITGENEMPDFSYEEEAPWKQYKDKINGMYITDGITYIGAYTLIAGTSVKQLYIPASVEAISADTIEYAEELTDIHVAEDNAMYASVNGILFNKDYTELIKYPSGKTDASYVIPDTVEIFAQSSMAYNAHLTQIVFPKNVRRIGWGTTDGCWNLRTVTIENAFCQIESGAISTIEEMTCLTIKGYSGSTAESYAQKNDIRFESLGSCDQSLGGSCGENLTWDLQLDGTLTVSGSGAMELAGTAPWQNYSRLVRTVIIGEGVTTVADRAFLSCTNLAQVSLPASLQKIGYGAFAYCESIRTLALPSGLQEIGEQAFVGTAIEQMLIPENNMHYSSDGGVLYNKDKTMLIQAPNSLTEYTVADSVQTIGMFAFYGCEGLAQITLGKHVKQIENGAFYGCKSLQNVYYGSTQENQQKMQISTNNAQLQNALWHYTEENDYIVGDLNGDGVVTDADAIYLLWHALFPETNPVTQNADMNGDGVVTDADAIYLLWHALFPDVYPLK